MCKNKSLEVDMNFKETFYFQINAKNT